jgi:hypothetical protein
MKTLPGMESADPVYAARIAELVATYITNGYRGSPAPLFTALGCHSIVRNLGDWSIVTPAAPDPCNEVLIRNVLLQVLRNSAQISLIDQATKFSMLHGLSLNHRWHDCLSSEDDAYCLAALCLWHAVDRNEIAPDLLVIRGVVELMLLVLLEEWVQADLPLFTVSEIGRALFGEAWYQFSVDLAGVWNIHVPQIVYTTRPLFQPGLTSFTPKHLDDGIRLPALEGP